MKGSDFLAAHLHDTREQFEAAVLAARDSWVTGPAIEIPLQVPGHTASLFVAADYFAIGEGDDVLYCPLSAPAAQAIADITHALLPTQKIVDLVWRAASAKVEPITGGELGITIGGADQMSVRAAGIHSAAVRKQLEAFPVGSLVAGSKKDVVISNRLEKVDGAGNGGPGKVCIYGWHHLDGTPIQPLSTRHERTYEDYSHGLRLVFETMLLDGETVNVADVLSNPKLASMISYEVVLRVLRQPAKPSVVVAPKSAPAPQAVRTLRSGSSGADVAAWQVIVGVTPTGFFGPVTEATTKIWQKAHGLTADGVVGPQTQAKAAAKETPGAVLVTPGTDHGPVIASVGDLEGVAFVQARNCTHVPAGRQVLWVFLHSMEISEKGDTAEACANYFKTTDRLASAHLNVDSNSVVQSVLFKDIAFGAPGGNKKGIHIEQGGFARQTADEWSDDYSSAMLVKSAWCVRKVCDLFHLPFELVDAEGLLVERPGISTHYQATLASKLADQRGLKSSPFYGKSSGHTDPGSFFPMAHLLELVRSAA